MASELVFRDFMIYRSENNNISGDCETQNSQYLRGFQSFAIT